MKIFSRIGDVNARLGASIALAGLAAILALGSACTTDETSGSTDSAFGLPDGGGKGDLSTVGDLGPSDDLACTPEVQSCSGLCGPVRDNCTGQTFHCGGCMSGTVCDLDSHTCVTPTDPCSGMGSCGSTKNACGQRVTCSPFYCPSTSDECNPDTNKCQTCQTVSCEDLGYQCGPAWLGCGPSSNTQDCGSCPTAQVCNNALHICEPANGGQCGGMTPAQLCDAAATSDGLQCGIISNGCGGLVDCTSTTPSKYSCPTGQTCGGAGIPNHCSPAEPPVECVAAGYNCGTLASACGGTVSCGTCDASQNFVCTVAPGGTAGVCSLVCNEPQKSCNADYGGACGSQLDNNCWPNKLDCPCPSGQVCSTNAAGVPGTCSAPAACAKYTNGGDGKPCSTSPSSAFPEGDGTNLTCPCGGGEVCINIGTDNSGTCCTHPTCSGADGTPYTVPDTCGGSAIQCCTSKTNYNGTCCTPKTGAQVCPNDGTYSIQSDGCGGKVVCGCANNDNPTSGLPVNVGDPAVACCAEPTCGTQCDGSVTSSCSGKKINCGTGVCGSAGSGMTFECQNHMCCQTTTFVCPDDDQYHVIVDACGVSHTCDCNRSKDGYTQDPKDSSNKVINGAGCCTGVPSCGTDCAGDVKSAVCKMPSSTTVVPTRTCNASVCSNTQCCDPSSKTCKTATGCAANSCATVNNGCGTSVACSCPNGEKCESNGTCDCDPPSCGGKCNPAQVTNACGDTVSCACTGSNVCGAGNACCAPQSCANLPSGKQCGQLTDSCTGNTISCGCSSSQKPNSICNTSGQCDCQPTKCCSDTGNVKPCLQPGPYSNDGCGNAGTCAT